ncbi:MAG: N-6 DNA methylase [Polyangiaceae bacterium]|nr:N-6 DNA methylase [Polyangiaceae bacterium]
MALTPEAKKLLAEAIRGTDQDPERGIRAKLIGSIDAEAERLYRWSVPLENAGLDETGKARRRKLEAFLEERASTSTPPDRGDARRRTILAAEKEVAATFVNRIVLLRQLEAMGLSKPHIVTGGWKSRGFAELRAFAPELCAHGSADETEGYGTLLGLLFDELAVDLPGVFGDTEADTLFPIPASAMRDVVDRLDEPALTSAWTDDTTLGWVYQYWNDPERRSIDELLDSQQKLSTDHIAAKTQLFTERYMVDWLLHHSLGHVWACLCRRNGWVDELDSTRWTHFKARTTADEASHSAPRRVEEIRLLDPACGSGHFLVIAFDLFADLYRRQARLSGRPMSDQIIAEAIVEHNLHGLDIDPRAVQIATCAIHVKARAFARTARPKHFNLAAAPKPLGTLARPDTSAAGADLFRDLLRAGSYHVVAGNPPYFGTQSLEDASHIDVAYPEAKENLCTAFIARAMELAADHGQIAFVTIRNWLYTSQLASFRSRVFRDFAPVAAVDLGLGAFDSLPSVETFMFVSERGPATQCLVHDVRDGAAHEKATLLSDATRIHRTSPTKLATLRGSPFVYRWPEALIAAFVEGPLLGDVAPVRVGMKTSDNLRFIRKPWELPSRAVIDAALRPGESDWAPYVKGAAGKAWIEPLSDLVRFRDHGIEIRIALEAAYGQAPQGEKHFFRPGVAFSTIGRSFVARVHRYPSIFDVAGSSVFPPDVAQAVCLLNRRSSREVVEDLNPTINFQVGDVARIPFLPDPRASEIMRVLDETFSEHEGTDERSFRFVRPGPSRWQSAQRWAQAAVDTPRETPLCPLDCNAEEPADFATLSFEVGVALGRFNPEGGVADDTVAWALPSALLYLSAATSCDSLDQPACDQLRQAWKTRSAAFDDGSGLRGYLRKTFFDAHRRMYENRPIYFPVSSKNRSFVGLALFHRLSRATLSTLLADWLYPDKRRLEGELEDVSGASSGDDAGRSKRRLELRALLSELDDFIANVTEIAESGPRPSDSRTPPREVDRRFDPSIDDGVLVTSASMWPLLEPAWKDPKKWWAQIASRSGPKGTHFEWSHVAARYFPSRVNAACESDPVVASAHRCLWRLHPRTAFEWEVRLRNDRDPKYRIDEPDRDRCFTRFVAGHPDTVREIEAAEERRRARKAAPRSRQAKDDANA